MPKVQKRSSSTPNASNNELTQANTRSGTDVNQTLKASNTGATQVTTRSGTMASQRNLKPNIVSGEIIRAIKDLKTDIKEHKNYLKQEITQLRHEINGKLDKLTTTVQRLSDRIDEAESRVELVEGWSEEATETLSTYFKQQRTLQQKLMDLQSRLRRNDILIFGVAEGEEGNSALQYVEKIIKSELPASKDLDLKIQRAYRSLAPRAPPDAPPRPIVVNCLEFTEEFIHREAWKKRKIQVGGKFIYFDHDYASEIVKKRKEYNAIKKTLKEKGSISKHRTQVCKFTGLQESAHTALHRKLREN